MSPVVVRRLSSDGPQQRVPKWLGPLLAVGAVAIAAYGSPAPGVPEWVGVAGAATFFFAGLTLTAQAFGLPRLAKAIAPLVAVALGAVFTWAGFAPGERQCSGSIGFFGFGLHGATGCKLVFAIGAVLFWLFFAAVLSINYLRRSTPGE